MENCTVTRFTTRYSFDKKYETELLCLVVKDPEKAIDAYSKILKHDRTTTVALISRDNVRWIIKRYNTKNSWHALRRMFRRSRAVNCWQMSQLYAQSGIPIPAPIAYIEKRLGPLRGKSYFINEYVEADNLLTYLTTQRHLPDVEATEKLAIELFETLCSAGIVHGDMKATNILVSNRQLFLLDLDASKKTNKEELFKRGYRRDRVRFLKNWENHPELYQRFSAGLPT